MILLPLVLACTAFLFIGGYLVREQEEYGLQINDYNVLIDPTQASRMISDEIFLQIKNMLESNPSKLEDRETLSEINKEVENRSSYIIVRKQNRLYYTGNEVAAKQIFDKLPDFQKEMVSQKLDQSFYYDDMKKLDLS